MTTETAIVTAGSTAIELKQYTSADQNPARVYLASLAPGSVRTMQHALDTIAQLAAAGSDADSFPWGRLRYQHTQAIRAKLAAEYDAATANKMLSALRQVLKAAWRLGQFKPTPQEIQAATDSNEPVPSGSDLYMAAADIANVKGEKPDQAAGRALTLGELMALVTSCNDGTATGARDAAILAVAYAGGLRRAEIVGLTMDSFDAAAEVLTVKGKRNKTRTVPMQNGALSALKDWLQVRGDTPGALFTRIGKGGRLTHEGLTTQAVYYVFTERAQAAGVAAFSPHDMRRTFAGDMLDAGVDISTVQKLMGHSNVTTTAGYDRRGERAKKDAAKRLHFPYQGRK
jgi:integrase